MRVFFFLQNSRWISPVYYLPTMSEGYILASSLHPSVHSVQQSILFVYLFTYWSDFESSFVQMISIMYFRYPVSFVKIDPLALVLWPLF